jgi:zinc ribbon protein
VASCVHCGARLDDDARYCLQCGRRTDASDTAGDTHFYGVTPTSLVLVLVGAAAGIAVVLFILGHWPIGLVVVGIALLLLLAVLESARRTERGSVTRSTADALYGLRSRATVAAESVATRGRAAKRLHDVRGELQRLGRVRNRLLFELGDAVYRGDDPAAEAARGRIGDLDRLAAEREAEMQAIVEARNRRIERGRLEVQPTEVAEVPREPSTPTPGEANPPEPARIPEPYPPPDEGSPPQPAVIPEPEPAVIPEPSPRGVGEEQR